MFVALLRPLRRFSVMSHLKLLARKYTDPNLCRRMLSVLCLCRSVLQPNSPQAMVKTALESANKSRLVSILVLDGGSRC